MFLFVSAMSLKEAGKLLESKVYDTLQLQVNNLHVRFVYFVLLKKPNSFKGSELTTLKHFSLDSEDDFSSCCRIVCHQRATTVLFRTTLTRKITLNELLTLMGSKELTMLSTESIPVFVRSYPCNSVLSGDFYFVILRESANY